ncbi:Nonaspanin [Gossypium australe]|uniref:Transmembrane 9 superfamily member n=1 Tax=Gossypium australe TaxID=47621 RepID=A0A5B6WR64_9ROSI|nr:Nonaspanin [Gossypium australe]
MKSFGHCLTFLIIGALILCYYSHVRSDASNHHYKDDDVVPLYANKILAHCPYLHFKRTHHVKEKKEALGEVLNGDRLVSAPYKLNFKDEKDSSDVCRKKLSKDEVATLRKAVDKDYYFQVSTSISFASISSSMFFIIRIALLRLVQGWILILSWI